ncbi:peroxiredoxin [Roseobacter sp. CCS2]|uniref:peroxiredoxin n=1 Tax=Roseobacter sp. CCS2 TaxID=391593 RepID=UPI0000F3E3E8|nr:peroxiredoxin [Roseobacter sp. CCS2]EBA12563.1 BcpB protein [Roseobacter sp. CCS2]
MSLTKVDWSLIPAPADDGKAAHLEGLSLPDVTLQATDGPAVTLPDLRGLVVFYIYPMTGRPDRDLPDGWDQIPGARGCTPQSCAFRDHYAELREWGVTGLYGISTQTSAYQKEAAERLHLPFPLLSDADHVLGKALNLPGIKVEGEHLHKRLTMIVKDGVIAKTFYPVFPPDQDAANVIAWLRNNAEERA